MRINALSSTAALLLAITSASCSVSKSCGTCIEDSEVLDISQRWLNAFATSGPGGVETLSSVATEDVYAFDQGESNIPGVYATNYNELYQSILSGPYGGDGVTNVTYNVISTFHSCDHIALRWQQNVITTDKVGHGSKLPAGTNVSFLGTDLLTIELSSRKVRNATTSSDLLVYYQRLGYNLGSETA